MKEIDIKTPDVHLVTVLTEYDLVQAELVRNTLLEHEIPCELGGEHQGGFTGTLRVDIIVKESDAERARDIIEEHHGKRQD